MHALILPRINQYTKFKVPLALPITNIWLWGGLLSLARI